MRDQFKTPSGKTLTVRETRAPNHHDGGIWAVLFEDGPIFEMEASGRWVAGESPELDRRKLLSRIADKAIDVPVADEKVGVRYRIILDVPQSS